MLSLKDLLTYGKSLEKIDNKTKEMERKNQRDEEINKVVKKLLGKNRDKSKRNGCTQRKSNKVCFRCRRDFSLNGDAQQQEKIVIYVIKLDTFHTLL